MQGNKNASESSKSKDITVIRIIPYQRLRYGFFKRRYFYVDVDWDPSPEGKNISRRVGRFLTTFGCRIVVSCVLTCTIGFAILIYR
jgi:hypothetical protein